MKKTLNKADNIRINTFSLVTTQLAQLSDKRLTAILNNVATTKSSIGGTTAMLTIGEIPVFIKKIPLTDIEQQPENIMSTANLFQLPLYYQYGISSGGFGAWRELAAHIMTTNWVLADECPHFPLMYHWRVLPSPTPTSLTPEKISEIERSVKYWGGSSAIRARLTAKQKASADLVLFLEYFPETLNRWFGNKITECDQTTQTTLSMVERDLITVTSFMKSKGFLHFDAHFENILTDNKRLYFTDFGLAISDQFDLSPAESDFFELHRNYDRCLVLTSLIHRVLATTFESKDRNTILQEYVNGNGTTTLPSTIAPIIKRYAPIAVLMKNFHQQLITDKTTQYPADKLEQLLSSSSYLSST